MAAKKRPTTRRWSQRVTDTSDAMTLEEGVFEKPSARAIARSVKRSAERSNRRKSPPFRSAMSMLTFYMNRGGKNLSPAAKQRLMRAKDELRKLYGREAEGTGRKVGKAATRSRSAAARKSRSTAGAGKGSR
jgi:hypothetical protein